MKNEAGILKNHFALLLLFISFSSTGQDTSAIAKSLHPKNISDIPHKTISEKWMWIHRTVAYYITKEKAINYDTAYIKTYEKRLVLTLPVSTRFLKFSLTDLKSKNNLNFSPNSQYDLGLSISSRWASFIINSKIKLFGSNETIKGKTIFRDYQLNLYGRKITTDMFVQYYKGFYIRNSKDFSDYKSEQPYEIRPDVFALNMGISSYYILNNKKFSYRNSFAFTETQKRTAGSFLFGTYYSYFSATGNPSLISDAFKSSFDSLSLISSGQTHHFGVNLGYIYTLVFFKNFYATTSLVQGLGGKYLICKRDDNSGFEQFVAGTAKLHVRFGMGYNRKRFFTGVMGMLDYFYSERKTISAFNYSYGKFMLYAGYRFSVLKVERKILRRLKLIDY